MSRNQVHSQSTQSGLRWLFRSIAVATTVLILVSQVHSEPPPANQAEPTTAATVQTMPVLSPTPAIAPAPEIAASPVTASTATASAAINPVAKAACDSYYPARLEGELRNSCSSGALAFARSTRKQAQVRCRVAYGVRAPPTVACLIGVDIAEDVAQKSSDYAGKRLACAAHYPVHTELDSYLQESCLAGIHLPRTMGRAASSQLCRELTLERSFSGPCAVGVSLSLDKPTESATGEPVPDAHNKLCDRYFDHRQLHQGYRSCLNARGLALDWSGKITDVVASCEKLVSDSQSELEKAACIVGVSIFRNLEKGSPTNSRFEKCGTGKVSYAERDVLACLTAASLLDFAEKREAAKACKTVFSARKSNSRADCERTIDIF